MFVSRHWVVLGVHWVCVGSLFWCTWMHRALHFQLQRAPQLNVVLGICSTYLFFSHTVIQPTIASAQACHWKKNILPATEALHRDHHSLWRCAAEALHRDHTIVWRCLAEALHRDTIEAEDSWSFAFYAMVAFNTGSKACPEKKPYWELLKHYASWPP